MRKVLPLLLICILLLAGCRSVSIGGDFSPGKEISKAQRIVAADAGGTETGVLETGEEIDAFVEAVNVEGWRLADLPEGLTRAGSFTLWQTETVTALLGQKEAEAKEICTFLIYQDGDYLTIETGFTNISITFSIPEDAAGYLRSLVQE